MKRLLMSLILILSLVTSSVGGTGSPALARAHQLFIPVACSTPQYFRWLTGTGFAVGPHYIMTAGHVDCGEGGVTEVSNDGGKSWIRVLEDQMYVSGKADVRVYYMPDFTFAHPAEFRHGVVGEDVAGYGIAFGEVATRGYVLRVDKTDIVASNVVIGGMSGSAIVGDDGLVVGMTVLAVPVTVGGQENVTNWVTVGVSADLLTELLSTLDAAVQERVDGSK